MRKYGRQLEIECSILLIMIVFCVFHVYKASTASIYNKAVEGLGTL